MSHHFVCVCAMAGAPPAPPWPSSPDKTSNSFSYTSPCTVLPAYPVSSLNSAPDFGFSVPRTSSSSTPKPSLASFTSPTVMNSSVNSSGFMSIVISHDHFLFAPSQPTDLQHVNQPVSQAPVISTIPSAFPLHRSGSSSTSSVHPSLEQLVPASSFSFQEPAVRTSSSVRRKRSPLSSSSLFPDKAPKLDLLGSSPSVLHSVSLHKLCEALVFSPPPTSILTEPLSLKPVLHSLAHASMLGVCLYFMGRMMTISELLGQMLWLVLVKSPLLVSLGKGFIMPAIQIRTPFIPW